MPGIPEEKGAEPLPPGGRARQKLLCDVLFGACGSVDYERIAGERLEGYSLCLLGAAGHGAAGKMLAALNGIPACKDAMAFAVAPGRVAVLAGRTWQIGSRPGCDDIRSAVERAVGFAVESEAAEGSGCEELHESYLMLDGMLNERLRRACAPRERQAAVPPGRSMKPVLMKAVDYIEKHYNESITLHDVAEHAYASPFYISRLFKKELDVSFVDYLGKLRVDNACRLLCETNLRILEVSERVGIQDAHYFAKLFKKHAGMSPSEFRAANKP